MGTYLDRSKSIVANKTISNQLVPASLYRPLLYSHVTLGVTLSLVSLQQRGISVNVHPV